MFSKIVIFGIGSKLVYLDMNIIMFFCSVIYCNDNCWIKNFCCCDILLCGFTIICVYEKTL